MTSGMTLLRVSPPSNKRPSHVASSAPHASRCSKRNEIRRTSAALPLASKSFAPSRPLSVRPSVRPTIHPSVSRAAWKGKIDLSVDRISGEQNAARCRLRHVPEGSANDITNEHGIELICSGCDLTQLELKRQTLMRGDDEGKRRNEVYSGIHHL